MRRYILLSLLFIFKSVPSLGSCMFGFVLHNQRTQLLEVFHTAEEKMGLIWIPHYKVFLSRIKLLLGLNHKKYFFKDIHLIKIKWMDMILNKMELESRIVMISCCTMKTTVAKLITRSHSYQYCYVKWRKVYIFNTFQHYLF
jgi:hypothetical protein